LLPERCKHFNDPHEVIKEDRIHTERRTPTPANITFAGENTCQMKISAPFSDKFMT
jgi:hypothetical protein